MPTLTTSAPPAVGLRLFLSAACALGLAACVTPNVAPSGFLTGYAGLGDSDESGLVRISTSSADVLSAYTTIVIDPPTMIEARLSAKDAADVRNALMDALLLELGKDRMIVAAPSGATLRVRYAIARVDTSNVALNALTTAVIGAVDYGSLALEVEVVDAASGERRAAMTWARGAKPTNVLGAYAATGHARALAPDFARRVALLISPKMPG